MLFWQVEVGPGQLGDGEGAGGERGQVDAEKEGCRWPEVPKKDVKGVEN